MLYAPAAPPASGRQVVKSLAGLVYLDREAGTATGRANGQAARAPGRRCSPATDRARRGQTEGRFGDPPPTERARAAALHGLARLWDPLGAWALRVAALRFLVGRLIAFDLVLSAALAGSGYLLFGPGQQHQLFRDLGPGSWLSVFHISFVGLLGVLIARRTGGARQRWNNFWLLSGVGFLLLSLDAPFDLHGKIGSVVEQIGPFEHPLGFHRASDAVLGVYFLAGAAVVMLQYRQLLATPAAFLRFVLGGAFAVGTIAVDGFGPDGSWTSVFEETLELVAGAWLVGAYAARYREIARGADRAPASELAADESTAMSALAAAKPTATFSMPARPLRTDAASILAPILTGSFTGRTGQGVGKGRSG